MVNDAEPSILPRRGGGARGPRRILQQMNPVGWDEERPATGRGLLPPAVGRSGGSVSPPATERELIHRHIGESAIATGSRSEDRHRPVQRIRCSYDDRIFGSHDDVSIGRIVLGRACAVLPC